MSDPMKVDPDELLTELLEGSEPMAEDSNALTSLLSSLGPRRTGAQSTPSSGEVKPDSQTHSQWAVGGNGRYFPVGQTSDRLKAGVYAPFMVGETIGLELIKVASDSIYRLPDMATEAVLIEAEQFWASEERYRKHNLLYKRGIILWGPPGGGKTATVKLLMNELVKKDGIVVLAASVGIAISALKALRRIEKDRNLIVVLEDIDEIIRYNGEALVLSMLDGEDNIDRVLHLATTNYPELLGARIMNRPSRFDQRIYVGMPEAAARREYLVKATDGGLNPVELDRWVTDTNTMSIAHLRELVAAVYCLDQPYDTVIRRLGKMAERLKGESGFKDAEVGFKNAAKQGTANPWV